MLHPCSSLAPVSWVPSVSSNRWTVIQSIQHDFPRSDPPQGHPDRHFFAPFWNKPGHVEVIKEIEAPMTRLDPLFEREGIVADAIKIDVQGGEAAVISGATRSFRSSIILAEIECSFAARYERQEHFDEIVARMRELGFALLDVRRLKRYRYRNAAGVDDASLGFGMRAGRLGFCDAIFLVEPDDLWRRIEGGGGANGPHLALKAMVLLLTYGSEWRGEAAGDWLGFSWCRVTAFWLN